MAVEPVDDGRKHALVVRDELADCPVVVVGCDAEVTGDTVLVSHRAEHTVDGAGREAALRAGHSWPTISG